MYILNLLVIGWVMIYLKTILASNIKTRRKQLGLTQEKLAELVDTAPTYIAMIEAEKRTPSFKMIERIAEALKIEAPELFSTKEYPVESTSQIQKDLMSQFDKFLRATVNQVRGFSVSDKETPQN